MDNISYRGIEYSKEIGTQIAASQMIYCPRCNERETLEHQPFNQPMSSIGDMEHYLFCPHCELEFTIVCDTKLE